MGLGTNSNSMILKENNKKEKTKSIAKIKSPSKAEPIQDDVKMDSSTTTKPQFQPPKKKKTHDPLAELNITVPENSENNSVAEDLGGKQISPGRKFKAMTLARSPVMNRIMK